MNSEILHIVTRNTSTYKLAIANSKSHYALPSLCVFVQFWAIDSAIEVYLAVYEHAGLCQDYFAAGPHRREKTEETNETEQQPCCPN